MKATMNKIGFAYGGAHAIFSNAQGEVYGIGKNSMGQLGNGTTNSTSSPVQVDIENVIMFDCGYEFSAFLTVDGDVYVCGHHHFRTGSMEYSLTPVKVAEGVIAITTNGTSLFTISNVGTVKHCGPNHYYQAGRSNCYYNYNFVSCNRVTEVYGISATPYRTFFLKTNGSVEVCGSTMYGAGGTGTRDDHNGTFYKTPATVPINDARSVSANHKHTLFLTEGGTAYASGRNSSGQLGTGTNTDSSTPTLCDIAGVTQIAAGLDHSLFLRNDGTVWASGSNKYGQLGTGNNDSRISPTRCAIDGVLGIYAGDDFSAFLTEDGLHFAGNLLFQ